MRICLTFDNGPTPIVTPAVLETLARYEVLATFFVVGCKLDQDGVELTHRAATLGHRIGNHTWSHSGPLGSLAEPGAARDEIERTQRALGRLGRERLFRPVGGGEGGVIDERLLSAEAVATLIEGEYTVVLWNSVPHDWDDPDGWVERALQHTAAIHHAVVVVHDIASGAMAHLDEFLGRATTAGAMFTQEFPASCLPMVNGVPTVPLGNYISDPRVPSASTSSTEREGRDRGHERQVSHRDGQDPGARDGITSAGARLATVES